eukprot:jgi/Galph1/4433/GphlegSOOS_G3081.1
MEEALEPLLEKFSNTSFGALNSIEESFLFETSAKLGELQQWYQICDKFQDNPQLLDSRLQPVVLSLNTQAIHNLRMLEIFFSSGFPSNLSEETVTCACSPFLALYYVSKVRGAKCIARLFPCQIEDLYKFLLLWRDYRNLQKVVNIPWQVSYILFLILSKLALLPFNIVDLRQLGTDHSESQDKASFLMDTIDHTLEMLRSSSKVQDGAAFYLAKILTRPDITVERICFLNTLFDAIGRSCKNESDITQHTLDASVENAQIGYLRTVAWMLESGRKADFEEFLEKMFDLFSCLSQCSSNILIRHLCVKNIQRLGLLLLPERGASWLHKQNHHILHLDHSFHSNEESQNTEQEDGELEDQEADLLSSIMNVLMQMLSDKNTVIRYSSSKGIARICMRLPRQFAEDVLHCLLENIENGIGAHNDNLWHGTCLVLAECAKRGIFHNSNLSIVSKFVSKALRYDLCKGSLHIGPQVRDAACYVCWAFARSYHASIPTPFLMEMVMRLACLACTDREINCRRAAAAALQEFVGRVGKDIIPHGIELITTADYFSLSDISESYLQVLPNIATLDVKWYKRPIFDELLHHKIGHWDTEIRKLASNALAVILKTNDDVSVEYSTALEELLTINLFCEDRKLLHGSLLTLGKLISLYGMHDKFQQTIFQYREQISRFLELHDKGKFSEQDMKDNFLKIATCQFLESLYNSRLFCNRLSISLLLTFLQVDDPVLQDAAAIAFGAACNFIIFEEENKRTDLTVDEFVADIVLKMINTLHSDHRPRKRGFIIALSYLPTAISHKTTKGFNIKGKLIEQYLQFIKLTSNLEIPQTLDEDNGVAVEMKIASLESFSRLMTTVLKDIRIAVSGEFTDFENLLKAIGNGLDDYTTDSRGDVGSWVRITAMHCFVSVVTCATEKVLCASKPLLKCIIHRVIRNCFERIDKTRLTAAETLKAVYQVLPLSFIKEFCLDVLQQTLDYFESSLFLDYTNLYKKGTVILKHNVFRIPILLGFIAAFGGTGLQNKEANKEFSNYIKTTVAKSTNAMSSLLKDIMLITTSSLDSKRNRSSILRMLILVLETAEDKEVVQENWILELLGLLVKNFKSSKDINILSSLAEMLVEATVYQNSIRQLALQHLMLLIVHPYAKIRQLVSDRMQIQLLTYEEKFSMLFGNEKYYLILDLLQTVQWDKNSSAVLKQKRNELCQLFGFEPPKQKQ